MWAEGGINFPSLIDEELGNIKKGQNGEFIHYFLGNDGIKLVNAFDI